MTEAEPKAAPDADPKTTEEVNPAMRAAAERAERLARLRDERRMRLFTVPYNFAVFLLQAGIDWKPGEQPSLRPENRGVLRLPTLRPNLPPDAYVLQVWYDNQRHAFCLLVLSEDFEPVPPSEQVPTATEALWEAAKIVTVESVR